MNEGRAVRRSRQSRKSVHDGKVTLKRGGKSAGRGKASKERGKSSGWHVVKTSEQQLGPRNE